MNKPSTIVRFRAYTNHLFCYLLILCCTLWIAPAALAQDNAAPARDDRNGVSVFDLVLISKHILGVAPLTSPYQLIAADVNRSHSITTFDVVTLKKLLLGINDTLADNTSWRFVPKNYVFPNPSNPWDSAFPENYTHTVGRTDTNFYAIKIGDVNHNAVTNNLLQAEENRQNNLSLGYANTGGKRGQMVEIPVFMQQTADLAAWQMALQYNPDALKIKGIRWTTIAQPTQEQDQDWHIVVSGQLRLLWMDRTGTAVHLQPNAPLAYVQVELLRDQRDLTEALHLWSAKESIASEGYTDQGVPATFSLAPVRNYQAPAIPPPPAIAPKPTWTATVYPNPSRGQFRIEVSLPEGGSGTIALYDALDRSCATKPCTFAPGLNVVTSAQLSALLPGQYTLRVDTPLGRQTLRLMIRDLN